MPIKMHNKSSNASWNTTIIIVILIPVFSTVLLICLILSKPTDYASYSSHDHSRGSSDDSFPCVDRPLEASVEEKGSYLVYYNIIRASARFKCDESVTITTIGDYTFMDNIVPLVEKWKGPISVALYSPGFDFVNTLVSIDYLRQCTSELVKEFVTFHMFHERDHIPQLANGILPYIEGISNQSKNIDCRVLPPYLTVDRSATYRNLNNLKFGINLGRNIARRGVQTHYFLASDLELYPSEGLIPHFLQMIRTTPTLRHERLAFALPVFEVQKDMTLPTNKLDLQQLLHRRKAVTFHEQICSICHTVPKSNLWKATKAPVDGHIYEFARARRQGYLYLWEPFFIGTQADPMHDERLYWEGAGDKMVQAYAMCLLDYEFVVLENAFLVHKAGIKQKPPQTMTERNNSKEMMQSLIKPELDALYGYRKWCAMVV